MFHINLRYSCINFQTSTKLQLTETISAIFMGIHVVCIYGSSELQEMDTRDPFFNSSDVRLAEQHFSTLLYFMKYNMLSNFYGR